MVSIVGVMLNKVLYMLNISPIRKSLYLGRKK